jgi:hypothetical protein
LNTETEEIIQEYKEYEDAKNVEIILGGVTSNYCWDLIPAREFAEDYAYMKSDKGWYEIMQL